MKQFRRDPRRQIIVASVHWHHASPKRKGTRINGKFGVPSNDSSYLGGSPRQNEEHRISKRSGKDDNLDLEG